MVTWNMGANPAPRILKQPNSNRHPLFSAYLALVLVCFLWGTTYLGIRVALESFSPAQLMCLRYLFSGAILLVATWIKAARFPSWRETGKTAACGLVTIGCGTGSLVVAEQWIPSGLAALIVSAQPFWMIGMEALWPGGEPLHGPAIGGLIVGLLGVAFLVWPGGSGGLDASTLLSGFLVLQFGAAMWAAGSIAQRRVVTKAHPFVLGGVQQLAVGVAFLIPALLSSHRPQWTQSGIVAILYLGIFGGVVGYSSYIFAMDRLPVALVSIYTYINPLVAIALGWLFYREPFGWKEVGALAIIFLGVAFVKRASRTVRSVVVPASPVSE